MSFGNFLYVSVKFVLCILLYNLVGMIIPSILHGQEGIILTLLTCESQFDCIAFFVHGMNVAFITGLLFVFFDYYNETTNQLHLKRIKYPNRRALYKINWFKLNEALHWAMINTFFTLISLIFMYVPLAKLAGLCDYHNINNYSTIWNLLKIPLWMVLADSIFYFGHYLFHIIPYLHEKHKIHHKFIDCYAITANASHPLEFIFVGVAASVLPLIILKMPLYWAIILNDVGMINSAVSHCGYIIAPNFSAIPHDFHHHFTDVCYGAGSYMDGLFKTRMQDVYPNKFKTIKQLNQL